MPILTIYHISGVGVPPYTGKSRGVTPVIIQRHQQAPSSASSIKHQLLTINVAMMMIMMHFRQPMLAAMILAFGALYGLPWTAENK